MPSIFRQSDLIRAVASMFCRLPLPVLTLVFVFALCKAPVQAQNFRLVNSASDTATEAHYGQLGVADSANTPGQRQAAATWKSIDGTLWLFGGLGSSATGSGMHNDLWKLDPATHVWTWMSGNSQLDAPGQYGLRGIPSDANVPGARYGAATWPQATVNSG